MRWRAGIGKSDGPARPSRQVALFAALFALLIAGVGAICFSDWAEDWRLRRMSAAELETSARERSWDPLLLYQLGLSRARRGDHAGSAVALARAAGADPSMERALRVL